MILFRHLTNWIAAAPLLLLLVIFNVAVVRRYFFDNPLQWTEEISGLLMIWIVMIGAIAAERDNEHLSISVLTDLLPPRARATLALIVSVASSALLLYVAWTGYQLAEQVGYKVTDVLRISWYWIDIAVPVGCVFMALYTLHRGITGYSRAMQGEGL